MPSTPSASQVEAPKASPAPQLKNEQGTGLQTILPAQKVLQATPAPQAPQAPPPKDVQVRVRHAIEAGDGVVVTVKETATMLDVRRAVMALVGETKLSQVKLVKKAGQGFASLLDSETLDGRTEFLSMGRDLVR